MRRLLAAAAFLALAACDRAPEEPRVGVEEAWVRLPAVPGRPGALYFTLTANNDPTRLVAIESDQVERIELHDSRMEGGVARMVPLAPGEATFGNGRLVFEPGGKHAMLFGIDPAIEPGDRLSLTLRFDPAPPVDVAAEVRGAGGGHEGH